MLIVHAQEGGAFASVAIKARLERPALATLKRPADGPRAFRVEQSCRLLRYSSGNGQPMHQAALRQVVVNDGLVLHRAVVPHHDIAPAPAMAIEELRLDDVIRKGNDQCFSLVVGQPDDPGAIVAVDVEAPDAGARMCAHDLVLDARIALDRGVAEPAG